MPPATPLAPLAAPFSEKEFYLREFRGRAVAFAVPAAEIRDLEPLRAVTAELVANGTRVIVLSTERSTLESLLGPRLLSAAAPRLEGQVWRRLREGAALGLLVAGSLAFAPACRAIALRLGLAKLVWLDRDGGVTAPTGARLSFVHLDELRALLAAEGASLGARRLALLREVEAMLAEGLPAVNVCSVEGLADELFSYAGSGTLFTRERYIMVRRLGLDDFDAADDLMARGVEEGYLAPRSPEDVEAVLASGFGAFVEGRHLAGIGALLVDEASRAGEVASLYTLTRFLGEGVGGYLVSFAVDCARERRLDYVFACSTSERVGSFFERHGFRAVSPDEVPPAKWRGYDLARRARVHCYRLDLR
jgi:N-acetylglutamate synthase-like GNAT family acetyltransferase